MDRIELKSKRIKRRRRGIRKVIAGSSQRPRLAVFRSNRHIYAQLVDDLSGRTLAAASSVDKGHGQATGNCGDASSVGARLAERAKAAGVERIVFDRGGRRYRIFRSHYATDHRKSDRRLGHSPPNCHRGLANDW